MFLCTHCHGPEECWGVLSTGPCEACGKVAVCQDSHNPRHGKGAKKQVKP